MTFRPLARSSTGYYILLRDARETTPPRHLLMPHLFDDSWALHRAHILARRVIVLHDPDPKTIYPPPSWSELAAALDGELAYVESHLDPYPAYCVLNLCRILYSWETRDVVTSKIASGIWAGEACPEWTSLIGRAVASYAGEATAEDVDALRRQVPALYAHAVRRIAALRGPRG